MKSRWLNLALGILFALLFAAGIVGVVVGAMGCQHAPAPAEIVLPPPPPVRY